MFSRPHPYSTSAGNTRLSSAITHRTDQFISQFWLISPSFQKCCHLSSSQKTSLDPNELKNFRPISNLPFISKIIEKLVLVQISHHLSANNLLNQFQSAYRPGHSTETALLKIVNDLLLSLDDGKISILASLDLSAAFDTIDHNILLHRLQHDFGLSGTVLDWFSAYLSGRIQSVSVHSHTSVPASVSCGVP